MKISMSLLFALLSLSMLASFAYGQGCMGISYTNDNGNPPLGYPCASPRTAFDYGYVVAIFWDQNLNGPDAADTQPPVGCTDPGCVNYNTFTLNGDIMGLPTGYFLMDPYFCHTTDVPANPVYYLKVSRPNPGGVCFQSDTFRMEAGPHEWVMDSTNWHCVNAPCATTDTIPVAPTNVTATLDEYCLAVKVSWHHTMARENGFNVYVGNGVHVYTAQSSDTFAFVPVLNDAVASYYVTAFNAAGESDTSNHANGSTYLVRFANDNNTNITGYDHHGQPFMVRLARPSHIDGRCDFYARLYLLHDTSPGHTGNWSRFGDALCHDSLTDSISCIFPDDSLYYCKLLMVDSSYNTQAMFTDTTDSVFHLGPITSAGNPILLPDHFELSQNYPNPFNPTTEIRFTVPVQAEVRIKVYNLTGQLVRTLVQGSYSAGVHFVQWDGKSDQGIAVSSGLYLYRMEGPKFVQVKKMLMLK
jgi:hypothetical protein